MKKFFTLIAFLLPVVLLIAQSQRLVLFEHFTQASCPPCASTNPPLFSRLDANEGKIIPISYQVYWPGYDPMYEHNPSEVRTRVGYYGVTAAPNSVMDGNGPASSLTLGSQTNIDNRYNTPSPFEMNLSHAVSPRFDGVDINLEVKASQNISKELVLHIAVVEHEIHFSTPPGSNGETLFHNVMKKMLPGADGQDLPASWTTGQTANFTASWNFENVYDVSEIAVIAWIQNDATKEVLQAAFSAPNVRAAGPNDGLVARASATGSFDLERVCGNTASPVVEIMNAGSANLTSLDLFYSINGGAESTHSWTGNLGYLDKTFVFLPDYTFTNQKNNVLTVRTANPNGAQDDQTANDEFSLNFKPSIQTTTTSKIEVRPLSNPSKLKWELVNSENEVVFSGGPYTTPLLPQVKELTLELGECYRLTFDNQATSYNGILKLFNADGVELFKLDADPSLIQIRDIGTDLALGIDQVLDAANFLVYPNPATDFVQVDFTVKESTQLEFRVLNTLGEVVRTETGQFLSGFQNLQVDLSGMPSGMYFLQVRSNSGSLTRTFVIGR